MVDDTLQSSAFEAINNKERKVTKVFSFRKINI